MLELLRRIAHWLMKEPELEEEPSAPSRTIRGGVKSSLIRMTM
jgi:hypothetical protein